MRICSQETFLSRKSFDHFHTIIQIIIYSCIESFNHWLLHELLESKVVNTVLTLHFFFSHQSLSSSLFHVPLIWKLIHFIRIRSNTQNTQDRKDDDLCSKLSWMTLLWITFLRMTLSFMTLSWITLSWITLSRITLSRITFSWITFSWTRFWWSESKLTLIRFNFFSCKYN